MRKLILAISLAGSLFAGGVASANEGWGRTEVVRNYRPPAPVERMPRLRGYVWIPGEYRQFGRRYVLLPGHYQRVRGWRGDGWRRG
jgi:hypothetical protein